MSVHPIHTSVRLSVCPSTSTHLSVSLLICRSLYLSVSVCLSRVSTVVQFVTITNLPRCTRDALPLRGAFGGLAAGANRAPFDLVSSSIHFTRRDSFSLAETVDKRRLRGAPTVQASLTAIRLHFLPYEALTYVLRLVRQRTLKSDDVLSREAAVLSRFWQYPQNEVLL